MKVVMFFNALRTPYPKQYKLIKAGASKFTSTNKRTVYALSTVVKNKDCTWSQP